MHTLLFSLITCLSFSLFLQIVQKGFDGWWDGRIADKTGSFPASFVEEIHSRDEGVRLLEMMKKKKGGGGGGDEELEGIVHVLEHVMKDNYSNA